MKNYFFTCITLFYSTVALSLPMKATDQIEVTKIKHEALRDDVCDLTHSPLMRCDIYTDYKRSDKALNQSYHELRRKLPTTAMSDLKKKQREWVDFRDKTCLDLQERAACSNALCDGVEHDQCILDLTNIRIKELNQFLKNPGFGVRSGYRFETKYPPTSFY